jgi:hypothetical protein
LQTCEQTTIGAIEIDLVDRAYGNDAGVHLHHDTAFVLTRKYRVNVNSGKCLDVAAMALFSPLH